MPRRSKVKPFTLIPELKRAIVSIGPVNETTHCAFSCPGCYVGNTFLSYHGYGHKQAVDFVEENLQYIDVVYISGDTDSFYGGKKRKEEGFLLLEKLADKKFDFDILITTRHVMSSDEVRRLSDVNQKLSEQERILLACTSVNQLRHPHFEPPPIKSPQERIDQLHRWKSEGIFSVLAMRPLMPNVKYVDLLTMAKGLDAVITSPWYADRDAAGKVYGKSAVYESGSIFVFADSLYRPDTATRMYFDDNTGNWFVYGKTKIDDLRRYARKEQIPLFTKSAPVVTLARRKRAYKPFSRLYDVIRTLERLEPRQYFAQIPEGEVYTQLKETIKANQQSIPKAIVNSKRRHVSYLADALAAQSILLSILDLPLAQDITGAIRYVQTTKKDIEIAYQSLTQEDTPGRTIYFGEALNHLARVLSGTHFYFEQAHDAFRKQPMEPTQQYIVEDNVVFRAARTYAETIDEISKIVRVRPEMPFHSIGMHETATERRFAYNATYLQD